MVVVMVVVVMVVVMVVVVVVMVVVAEVVLASRYLRIIVIVAIASAIAWHNFRPTVGGQSVCLVGGDVGRVTSSGFPCAWW